MTAAALALLLAVQAPAAPGLDFQVYRSSVEPIFVKPRGGYGPGLSPCASCHVHNGTPLKLQPLQEGEGGRVYWSEEQSHRNFEVVSRLVLPGDAEQSRLLRKPLAIAAGGAPFHVGGKFWETKDDPDWRALAAWVRAARPTGAPAQPSLEPDFEFFRTCVQRIFSGKRPGLVECVHCHYAEPRNFAQAIPDGRSFWNAEESRQNFAVLRRYIEPGFPLMSRFLTHPLDPAAGGDHFHAGGRRWASQDDPEWRMLAAWVRGEPVTCLDGLRAR